MWYVNDFALIKENILSPNFAWHGTVDNFFRVVKASGYPFFSWNGRVYKVNDDKLGYTDTGFTIDQIK
jgi:hypothetical protein